MLLSNLIVGGVTYAPRKCRHTTTTFSSVPLAASGHSDHHAGGSWPRAPVTQSALQSWVSFASRAGHERSPLSRGDDRVGAADNVFWRRRSVAQRPQALVTELAHVATQAQGSASWFCEPLIGRPRTIGPIPPTRDRCHP